MKKQTTHRPTDAELAILRVLWQRGPSTVRQVQETLSRDRPTGYTTVLKMMQIMTDKGLVRRDESQRAHIYHPVFAEEETQQRLVGDLIERAFGGSTTNLVMQALSAKKASPEELAEIRRLLAESEGGEK
ncbi:BlaI/MecI/CopY family transcriptional regulator [Candidatus Poribacteria bacterium]|nr:BlaI/MecI/CopY family transcriptional regulator [Candidatus Poribacteria bacterium]